MIARVIVPASAAALTAALEGVTALNTVLLRKKAYPRLYKSGVRYRREVRSQPGREKWLTVPEIMKQGHDDCEGLACWRAAELRVDRGEPARAVVYRSGPKKFHAVVRRADGRIEDPSRKLGMGKKARY